MIVTLPTYMPNFKTWASAVVQDLKGINIPVPERFKDWRDWFSALREFEQLGDVPVCSKQIYPKDEDWRKAAVQFINNLPVN